MCFLNCNSLLTINYHSIIRPLNEVSTFSGLWSWPMLRLLYWILLTLEVSTENPVPECLIHNALHFTSQLKVKITFICMFSFISSKLLWERRHVLLFLFLRRRKCIFGEMNWLAKVTQLIICVSRLDPKRLASYTSVSLYLMAFHPAEPLANRSSAAYKYLSSFLLELSHCPVDSGNSRISAILFMCRVK